MAFILLIDTATGTASVGFGNDEYITAQETNDQQKDHAAFVQAAIRRLMDENVISVDNIQAVAVVNGPGSYTGLRVGLASAKGLCFALGKPLILLNTLEVMALASIDQFPGEAVLHCPLIDARRMEVFTAVYDNQLHPVFQPQPLILSPDSFREFLQQHVVFSGSGAPKLQGLINTSNVHFSSVKHTLQQINKLAQNVFIKGSFADVAYSEPFYLKNFYILSS